jgi:hypothetical protein
MRVLMRSTGANNMQAIITKYIGPMVTKGARIRATWQNFDGTRSISVAYNHALSARDNHANAAMTLVRLYIDGGNNWTCGELPNGNGYAFVMLGEEFSRAFNTGG